MAEATIFDKIISKEIPADIIYEDEHTLEETAERLQLTREKVRQIQLKAITKLQQIHKK